MSTSTIEDIQSVFTSFNELSVLIVGDIMVDHYVFGQVNRISPEAPVPIVEVARQERRLGGAANVALNVKQLGAKVMLASVIGDDVEGHALKQQVADCGIDNSCIILDQERKTTVKTRVVSGQQQLLRYDSEQRNPLTQASELALLDRVIDVIYQLKPSVVIVQDYNKGVLTPKVIANTIHNSRQAKIPTAVDPKFQHFLTYKGCTLFKPNLREAIEGLEMPINPLRTETLIAADNRLRGILKNKYNVITLSEKGMFVGIEDDHELIPTYARSVADVSGAGDTVIAVLAMGLALELDIFASTELANIAAGLVCGEVGVVPINKASFLKEAVAIFG